jgi:ribose transport system permease protein
MSADTIEPAAHPAVPAQDVRPARGRRLLERYAERLALPFLLAGLIVAFSLAPATRYAFATQANLQSLALTQCVVAIAAIAVTIPLVAGQFDVSVGPVLGMTSILTGKLTVEAGAPVWLAFVVGPVAGGVVGATSGYVVAYLKTNSFIITLGVGTVIAGVVSYATNNQIITGAPASLVRIGTNSWLGVPYLAWILLLVALFVGWLLRSTLFGRRLTQVGSNSRAAHIVGVNVSRTILLGFVCAGSLAGLAGVLLFAQTGAANPQVGAGYTLPALAAAFLGATTIRPGSFNVLGTLVGVFFVGVAVNGLTLAGAADWVQPVFNGGALVLAVALSSILGRRAGSSRSI